VQSFIHQYKSTSQNVSVLWSAFFMVCYHSGNVQYAKLIHDQMIDDRLLLLLFSDMTNSLPSNEIISYFHRQSPDICWTEIENDDQTGYIVHEFRDNDLVNFPSLKSQLNVMIDELKSVGVNWESRKNDLKELFCGHIAIRLALAQNLVSTLPTTVFQLTKTKPTCYNCHEGIKQLTLLRRCDIILRDSIRVHHFHNGKCSCDDKF